MSVADKGNSLLFFRPLAATATTNFGLAVDCQQYIQHIEIQQAVGIVTGTDPTLDGKMQDCADSLGVGLAGATYDHTGGASERLLTETSAFANYTFVTGDTIDISGAAGIPDGTYVVASRVDDDGITLAADVRLTADTTADAVSPAWADITGETFTQVIASNATESITINVDSAQRYVRWHGTIGGTVTPTFAVSVTGFGQQQTSAAQT